MLSAISHPLVARSDVIVLALVRRNRAATLRDPSRRRQGARAVASTHATLTRVRVLLLSNSGRPYLAHARAELLDFLGPARRIGFVTAASLGDEEATARPRARRSRRSSSSSTCAGTGTRSRCWPASTPCSSAAATRTRSSGASARRRSWSPSGSACGPGLPYAGTSAGSNVAGPNILTTNDWNVVGLTAFDALGLVPFNVNPHYLETDPAMAPGSETRDMRVAEYHVIRDNPVVGIEEGAMVRVEDGHGRGARDRPGQAVPPRPGSRLGAGRRASAALDPGSAAGHGRPPAPGPPRG